MTVERDERIRHAEQALHTAMADWRPACAGDDRFTLDHTGPAMQARLRQICLDCPLKSLCRDYASAVNPTAGYWAGRLYSTNRTPRP